MNVKRFISESLNPMVYNRAIKVALIVGIILNIINQWESIFSGFHNFHFTQFFLTFLVPYMVSSYSSVSSKFNFVSGEVASFDAEITCKHCNDSTVSVQKGNLVPYCPQCVTKTKWKIIKLLPPETFLEEDKIKSNALFAEYNPAPVMRINRQGYVIKANPTAQMLFNIKKNNEAISNVIPELKTLNADAFISSNKIETHQIRLNNNFYQLDLRALSDLGVFHIYASKNTTLVKEQNQRRLFENAIENTSDSVMITNTKGEIEYVNKAFEQHSGYVFNEIKGKNPRILKSGLQSPEVYTELWEKLLKGESWNGLFQNRKKNGDLYWEQSTISPIFDNDKNLSHFLAIKADVTQDLKLKDELKSFALFAQHNPAPVFRITKMGEIMEVNKAAQLILKNPDLISANIKTLLPNLADVDFAYLIENDEKLVKTVSISPNYYNLVMRGVSELGLCHIYGSDITQQVEAEQRIESMAIFARLNPEPVFRFKNDFRIVDANPAAMQTFIGLQKELDIRDIIPNFADLPIDEFILNDQILNREEMVNERIYRLKIKGVSQSNICVVYSSDITERVEQEKKIRLQAEKIQSSIRYASNIQAAVMPNLNYVNEILPENMILNLPRDVVSGDFYWIKKVEDSIVIAIADCTGHGVPGAFMSMLGVAFLNEIVKPGNLVANEILNKLREYVINTLSNSEGSRADGMDMSLCIIKPNTKTIQYAGANNPFVLINSQGLQLIKADKMPIGTYVKQDKPFTLHEIPYQPNDVVYLFSDGYQDQLGGPNIMKFGSKNFRGLLQQIYTDSFSKQKERLIGELNEWTKTYQRIDDVLVMGFKLE